MTRKCRLEEFCRVTLKPGKKRKLEFTLGSKDLGFSSRHVEYVLKPGTFKVCNRPNSMESSERQSEMVNNW